MKVLVTGAAGFIGYHLSQNLIKNGHQIIGLDNINDYYDINLKFDRIEQLGIDRKEASIYGSMVQSVTHSNFKFVKSNLEDRGLLPRIFEAEKFDVVCNLAAQAGVRYSLENPEAYIDSNIVGFLNVLECCRNYEVKHLVYASSSSVYGTNKEIPFRTDHRVDNPISLYAASKKSNELMAHTYSHLFGFPTTGLRFFTVYGPWGRPDMALFLFTDAIAKGNPIKVFNKGNMQRDFTYIDDIVEGVVRIIENPVNSVDKSRPLYKVYNIGNSTSVKLDDFIQAIEHNLGIKAERVLLPMQPGDVERTWADVSDLEQDYDYIPNTPITEGVGKFVNWYKLHYKL
ncbi:NAD-dependent epimerase [Flagellimonas hymeniacidonis]|uniref:NAD-dependent epimerase n=1 Tax=Flagellimonas hymeniacidonis TaxID=2603628 RepID=A0A5C8V4N6_9FLAO|nr:NAD-dependent epimerase [Flagellimonas hymeniacidonis]TXN35962.1 NAD-dependent epimerase [Flagellimonas hymeniacidonis]